MFCPNCVSERLSRFPNNRPVADFFCPSCDEEFEIKGQKTKFGSRVVDGAYSTMIDRLNSSSNPNLVLLQYSLEKPAVHNVMLVPKQFFVPEIIEQRPPLSATARRAGWIGCNIRLDRVPSLGKIFYVEGGIILDPQVVRSSWKETLSLRTTVPSSRGWLLQVFRVVERIENDTFELADVYGAEAELRELFPGNNNIRPKIRQQLQVLRDLGFIQFLGQGRYRRVRGSLPG